MNIAQINSALIVPSLNAGDGFRLFLNALCGQKKLPDTLLLLDSESDDITVDLAREAGFTIETVRRKEFNHGATRQLALTLCPDADVLIYMTQDAILASSDAIKNILAPFEDEKVGAVCGRQLPHADASSIAAHARLFNYPADSSIKSKNDISRIGVKAAFLSNSFAAYRRTALIDVGGFPADIIFGEDTFVAAKMLLAGWQIAYCAEATAYHSHNYSMLEEFRRYFDHGVFHSRVKWFLDYLGKAEGEGKKFVISEMRYLLKESQISVPSAILCTLCKYLAYKAGFQESRLPVWVKKHLSMNKIYWKNKL